MRILLTVAALLYALMQPTAPLAQDRSGEAPGAIQAEKGCAMPEPSSRAKVIVLGVSGTQALSNVTLGSQDNVIVSGRVDVEGGDDPIYIVITSNSAVIWQFQGLVTRIERVVLAANTTGPNTSAGSLALVGVTGVSPDRVTLLRSPRCVDFFTEIPSTDSINAVKAIRAGIKREPDIVAASEGFLQVYIPSMKIFKAVRDSRHAEFINSQKRAGNIVFEAQNRTTLELYHTFPGGIVRIDPKAVVATANAFEYDLLPSAAGLAQLLENGSLTQNQSGEYIIHRKIRYPAGLYSGSLRFLVKRDVPAPEGNPGFSCITMEEQPNIDSRRC